MSSGWAGIAGPVISLIGSVAPAAVSLLNKPKMPSVANPKPAATPVMPVKDDASAKAAAMREIAKRSSSSGRQSTNLYDKNEVLG